MSPETAPNRETILGAIVLAFSHSALKQVVGTDALRSVLTGQYRDLMKGGTLYLQPVWDLLSDQPGFEAESSLPPFCLLKTWESELNAEVILPTEIGPFSTTELIGHASRCKVPAVEKKKVFQAEELRSQREKMLQDMDDGPREVPSSSTSTRKPMLEAALALVALIGLGIAAFAIIGTMGSPKFESFQADTIAPIPATKAEKIGREVTATVEDATWFQVPEEERRLQLEKVLNKLRGQDIEAIIILDKNGKTRASGQWLGKPPKVEIRFQ